MKKEDCPFCEIYRKEGQNYCKECGNRVNCSECKRYLDAGYEYCGNCGSFLDCPECGTYRAMNETYCGNCGRRLQPAPPEIQYRESSVTDAIGKLSAVVAAVFLIIAGIALYVYAADIFSFLASVEGFGLLLLIPYPYVFMTLSGVWVQVYWIFLLAVISMCFVKVIHEHVKKIKEDKIKGKNASAKKTSLYWIGLMWPSTILLQMVAIYLVIILFDIELTVPDIDSLGMYASMFLLADAGVWEELITRVLIIGVPLFLIALARNKEKPWSFLLGGKGVDKISLILVVIAALVFGYGHESGWGLAKVIPAFIFGLAAGYLYIEYGLYASILMHFVNDYLSAFLWLGGSELIMNFMTIGLLGLGAVTTVVLALKLWESRKNLKDCPMYSESLK